MWLWMWIVLMLVLFVAPFAFGWGLRGWGPPTRRRTGAVGAADQEASDWGWPVTFLWLVLLLGVTWLVLALVFF